MPASELDSRYDHRKTETEIYKTWEDSGAFNPDRLKTKKGAKPFTIIMPPPNANGSLHVGHAVFVALQDIMIRYWRMRGRKALWLPGADHAGFETQVVFDKKLEKEGTNRFAMSREARYRAIWDFTQTNKKVMENQLRALGASCDWSREKFTLDPDIIQTVYDTFEKLYKDGLAYRDLRVVNWCPKHRTALSDLEVKYVEREDPLYYIAYGPLTLATVRPETKFGDTALAVNPKDARYKKYIGTEIEAKGVLGTLRFKVIGDNAVDQKFGTGVVKVTPAHDQTDFEIWTRHKDEIPGPKIIIDESGRLTGPAVGEFKGLKVAEAREKVAAKMQEIGILRKTDPHYTHQVATCYKCGSTLEPLPKPQWFVSVKPLAERAVKAVEKKQIAIHPDRSKKVYFHWLKNIRDWNISRQIIWGIRIPAWYCVGCAESRINPEVKARWFFVRHGETDLNKEGHITGQEDVPLNATGIEQGARAAEMLKAEKIDLILTSDLVRARQTAELVAKATGAEIVVDPELRERHWGIYQGKKDSGISELSNSIDTSRYREKAPGGESFEEVEARIWKAFRRHRDTHHHKNVVIIAHRGATRAFLKALKNLDVEQAITHSMENGAALTFDIVEPCRTCGNDLCERDPDVFDTWFSSGQWPFAALGYPKSKDYKTFYPTDVMETGYDILFFWITRMVMLSLYRTGKVPFKHVYLHGLVRDKDRVKMSKSKGNVVDPLAVAAEYGADALRMGLVAGSTAGNDIVISDDKVRGYRNFATKLWNIARFVDMYRGARAAKTAKPKFSKDDLTNLAAAKKVKAAVAKHIEKFEFHLALEAAYHYVWHTFADKVIEAAKPRLQGNDARDKAVACAAIEAILMESLSMLHPFMPFVTEALYRHFRPGKLLMVEKW